MTQNILQENSIDFSQKLLDLNLHSKELHEKFTYDLQEMILAMNSPRIKIPATVLSTDESFDEWLNT